jgi:hypothetical protein
VRDHPAVVSSDVFVFVADSREPANDSLQTAVSSMDGVFVEVNVPQTDLSFDTPTLAYVASIIGAFRIDVITYRGGELGSVAEVLDRFYSEVPALADPDSDGVFTIPELVVLLRASPLAVFHPWADPSKRSR